MMRLARISAVAVLTALVVGCQPRQDAQQLTDAEKAAIVAGIKSAQTVVLAANTTQNGATADTSAASKAGARALTFGDCPQVTLNLTIADALLFDLTLDYGDGCTPPNRPDQVCSGSVSGTLDSRDRRIAVTFNNLTCDDDRITGTVDLRSEVSPAEVRLSGSFDLAAARDEETFATTGTGTAVYDRRNRISIAETYEGTASDGTDTWNLTLTDLRVSRVNNPNRIPFQGQADLAGTNIRTLVVRFNQDSPTTGVVEISIDGSSFFEINLGTLDAAIRAGLLVPTGS